MHHSSADKVKNALIEFFEIRRELARCGDAVEQFGEPIVLIKLEEKIYEGVPSCLREEWSKRIASAIRPGDYSQVWSAFLLSLLDDPQYGLAKYFMLASERRLVDEIGTMFRNECRDEQKWEEARTLSSDFADRARDRDEEERGATSSIYWEDAWNLVCSLAQMGFLSKYMGRMSEPENQPVLEGETPSAKEAYTQKSLRIKKWEHKAVVLFADIVESAAENAGAMHKTLEDRACMYIAQSERLLELLQSAVDAVPDTSALAVDLQKRVLAYMSTRNRVYETLRAIHDAGVPLVLVRAAEEIVENIPDRLSQKWLDEYVNCLGADSDLTTVWPKFVAWLLDNSEFRVVNSATSEEDRQDIALVADLNRKGTVDPMDWAPAFSRVRQKYLTNLRTLTDNEAVATAYFAAKDPKTLIRVSAEMEGANGAPTQESLSALLSKGVNVQTLKDDHSFRSANEISASAKKLMGSTGTENRQILASRYLRQGEHLLDLLRTIG